MKIILVIIFMALGCSSRSGGLHEKSTTVECNGELIKIDAEISDVKLNDIMKDIRNRTKQHGLVIVKDDRNGYSGYGVMTNLYWDDLRGERGDYIIYREEYGHLHFQMFSCWNR